MGGIEEKILRERFLQRCFEGREHERPTAHTGRFVQDHHFESLVRKDLKTIIGKWELDIEPHLLTVLLVQSILGHAQNGHCEFGGNKYPHATIPDVIRAAGLDTSQIKEIRQQLINDVYTWANLALSSKPPARLVLGGHPLLGVGMLRNYHIEPVEVLRGMVLAGFMDNYTYRQETVQCKPKTINGFDLIIGGGETYLVNVPQLYLAGLDFEFLANRAHDEKSLEYLRELEIIVDKLGKDVECAYIRRKEGLGTSDDLAFIMIGLKYGQIERELGISAMLGAFVCDAVDTYDKCVRYPIQGGFDEALALYIQDAWRNEQGQLLVSTPEIHDVIYYSAKANNPKVSVSSSHRRFIEFSDAQELRPTIQAHIDFVEGNEPEEFMLGFEKTASGSFYQRARKRAEHMLEMAAA